MSAEAGFLDLVYEAAVDPDGWNAVLRQFIDVMGAHFAAMVVQDQITGNGHSIEVHTDPARQQLYFDYFGTRNPLLRITDLPARPRVFTDAEKIGRRELISTEYYNDYMRKYDMDSLLIARLAVQDRNTVVINVARSRHREQFGAPDIELANKFHPHLVRAVRLAGRFDAFRGLSCGLREMAERAHHAVFLVTAAGKIRYMNGVAHALLAADDGITSMNGVLAASTPDLTGKLLRLVAMAGVRGEERQNGGMAIARRNHRFPLSVIVNPVREERASDFRAGPLVLVSVSDPATQVVVAEQKLRDMLGLTRTETRIAMKLLGGLDTRKTAEALGVSFYTVRSHLSRMFEKTGTDGQAALVGLLTRVASQPCE